MTAVTHALGINVKIEAWAAPDPDLDLTLDQLVVQLRELGHEIIEVDREGNRVKVLMKDLT